MGHLSSSFSSPYAGTLEEAEEALEGQLWA